MTDTARVKQDSMKKRESREFDLLKRTARRFRKCSLTSMFYGRMPFLTPTLFCRLLRQTGYETVVIDVSASCEGTLPEIASNPGTRLISAETLLISWYSLAEAMIGTGPESETHIQECSSNQVLNTDFVTTEPLSSGSEVVRTELDSAVEECRLHMAKQCRVVILDHSQLNHDKAQRGKVPSVCAKEEQTQTERSLESKKVEKTED
uniref:uncharacterized protein n=1 Tax=Myxine glutinosa TaxID=7769 RepID=UPI00358F82D3